MGQQAHRAVRGARALSLAAFAVLSVATSVFAQSEANQPSSAAPTPEAGAGVPAGIKPIVVPPSAVITVNPTITVHASRERAEEVPSHFWEALVANGTGMRRSCPPGVIAQVQIARRAQCHSRGSADAGCEEVNPVTTDLNDWNGLRRGRE